MLLAYNATLVANIVLEGLIANAPSAVLAQLNSFEETQAEVQEQTFVLARLDTTISIMAIQPHKDNVNHVQQRVLCVLTEQIIVKFVQLLHFEDLMVNA